MNTDIKKAADTIANAKMESYPSELAFILDRKNEGHLKSWMMRLEGGFDGTKETLLAFEKMNVIRDVARLMSLATMAGPGSLVKSMARDIADSHGLEFTGGEDD